MKTTLAALPIVLLASACVHVEYMPYVGEQQPWPTAAGAYVKQISGISIYRGYPPTNYVVIGHLEMSGDLDSIEGELVFAAKKHDADGVLLLDSVTTPGSTSVGFTTVATPGRAGTGSALATSVGATYGQKSLNAALIRFRDRPKALGTNLAPPAYRPPDPDRFPPLPTRK